MNGIKNFFQKIIINFMLIFFSFSNFFSNFKKKEKFRENILIELPKDIPLILVFNIIFSCILKKNIKSFFFILVDQKFFF
jgi:hypothetical protein